MPFCSSCGTKVPAEDRFCQTCVHQFVRGHTPAPETPSAEGPNFLGPWAIGSFLGETSSIYKQCSLKIWAIRCVLELVRPIRHDKVDTDLLLEENIVCYDPEIPLPNWGLGFGVYC